MSPAREDENDLSMFAIDEPRGGLVIVRPNHLVTMTHEQANDFAEQLHAFLEWQQASDNPVNRLIIDLTQTEEPSCMLLAKLVTLKRNLAIRGVDMTLAATPASEGMLRKTMPNYFRISCSVEAAMQEQAISSLSLP